MARRSNDSKRARKGDAMLLVGDVVGMAFGFSLTFVRSLFVFKNV